MFDAIVNRTRHLETWQKIPWDDPDFSRRMLNEHLSQEHDAASRRTATIARHVAWIHMQVLASQSARILDLGCGPGLYSARLAGLGHTCTGIDFSPASIEYARQHSACTYVLGDVRQTAFGADYDLAMMIYGEINTFVDQDAQSIIDRAYAALKPGGRLLLEPHTYAGVVRIGKQPPSWHSAASGLFSDRPYLCLQESFFENGHSVNRFYIIDAQTGQTTTYGSMTRAYTETDYRRMLHAFDTVDFYAGLADEPGDGTLFAVVARKAT